MTIYLHWRTQTNRRSKLWPKPPARLTRALIPPKRLMLLGEAAATPDARCARLRQLKDQDVAMIEMFRHPSDVVELVDREL